MTESFDAIATVTIDAPIEKVWAGITDPDTIAQYMMGADVQTDWVVGHPITWSGTMNDTKFEDKGEILAVNAPHHLQMTHWSSLSGEADAPENYHVVTYDLSEADGATSLKLTQSNNPSQEAADAMANDGWTPMLKTLKSVLEGSNAR